MEDKRRRRQSARIWVSREVNRLRTLLAVEETETIVIEKALEELEVKKERLDQIQSEMELLIEDEELDTFIEEADMFLEPQREVKFAACKRIALTRSTNTQREQPTTSRSYGDAADRRYDTGRQMNESTVQLGYIEHDNVNNRPNAHLPKIQIDKYDGNYSNWPVFWDKFSALIHQTNLPTISKFSYLQSFLTGDALDTVRGLSLTEANYETAISILKERFGKKERIINTHIQKLLSIEIPNIKMLKRLWAFYNQLQSNIRSLENLDVNGTEYGVVLTPIVLSRLPREFRMEWARVSEGKECDLESLMIFLKTEISTMERSETFNQSQTQRPPEQRRDNRVSSAAALQSASGGSGYNNNNNTCSFCRKRHPSEKCWNVDRMSLGDIRAVVNNRKLCFKCFSSKHFARNCAESCPNCAGNHHRLFCKNSNNSSRDSGGPPGSGGSAMASNNDSNVNSSFSGAASVLYHASKFSNKTTVMQTLTLKLKNVNCTILFDSGSDKSYVVSSFVKKTKLKYVGREQVSHACFGEKGPRDPITRNIFEIVFETNGCNKNIHVTEIPNITVPMYRSQIPEEFLKAFDGKGPDFLRQGYGKSKKVHVDVLIGLDHYWELMTQNVIGSLSGLVAQETILGWILSGSYPTPINNKPEPLTSHQNLCLAELSDSVVRRFWEIESLGIVNDEVGCDKTIENFNHRVRFDGERYEVDLPWKRDTKALLVNNFDHASDRLEKLNKKLSRDPNLKERYDSALSQLEKEGVFEEVPGEQINVHGDADHPVFYLPHRPVIKDSSSTTKVRPVFDASAVGPTGVSLNSCMETGPYLTGNLLDVLIRFRRWKYALSGDITKAFFQIGVNGIDRDVHRFLWKPLDSVRIMRITRVPFGNTSSPFLLNATIKFHLSQQESSRAVEELMTNMYVDDWLTGADTIEEVVSLKSEGQTIMDKASMSLTKWCSNNATVAVQETQVLKERVMETDQHKVLGVVWTPTQDCFSFVGIEVSQDLIVTKRVVLSCISRIFDPIGFLQPFVMVAKILFQDLWKSGLQWDDKVPDDEEIKFMQWMSNVSRINEFSVPRCFVRISWENKKCMELHAFSDASEKAYGSCVYMKVTEEDGSVCSSLVIAKAKLAPVKKVTLPRLELLGCLLSARLIAYVMKTLLLSESTSYKCWTDSQVALHWIQSDANRWKTFVANRVTEIQELTSPDSWGHCPGVDNPADILSRGVMLDSLLKSALWLNGPSWLKNRSNMDPSQTELMKTDHVKDEHNDVIDELNECSTNLSVETKSEPLFPVERWGDFSKAVRVCALVLRFVNNLKACARSSDTKMTCELTRDEIVQGYYELLKDTQRRYFGTEISDLQSGKSVSRSSPLFKLKPFIDENGLMRMKGRLQLSTLSFDEKHPILLPKCHVSLLLVRREHLSLNHTGVSQMITSLRGSFWIMRLRSIVKSVKRQCVACSRHDSRLPCQEPSPIPKQRIERSNPFSVVGVDYAGPVYTSDFAGKKFYILLFTCAVIRAVHIELVDSLSLSCFLLAFRRFVARRGMPSIITSDNAKTFKAAAKELVRELADRSPKWQYITPRAPWCGGFWERLIKSIKLSLKKTLGLRSQTRCELETTLHQVEACINSRPLTIVNDGIDSNEPLTPSHFLLGRSDGHRPMLDICLPTVECSGHDLRQILRGKNVQLNNFWTVWQNEYIRNLPLVKHAGVNKMVEKGTMCLIKEDNVSRIYWPLGKIVKTYPGKDGIVRTVQVRTSKGCFTRPLGKICCLEILEETDDDDRSVVEGPDNQNRVTDEQVRSDSHEISQVRLRDNDSPLYVTRGGRAVKPNKRYT